MELALFPTICGLMLAYLARPLFQASLIDFVDRAPLTAIFLCWASGTSFMFFFASTITVCRSFFRPGVLFFIRDPDSPDFHPMREILERNASVQLKKIAISLTMYSVSILATIGAIVKFTEILQIVPLKLTLT